MTPATPAFTAASSSTFMTRPVQSGPAVPRLLAPVTVHPAPARRSAQARPIPSDAPVTSATRAGCGCPIWPSRPHKDAVLRGPGCARSSVPLSKVAV